MSASRKAPAPTVERELLRVETLGGTEFAEGLAELLDAEHLVLFAPPRSGGAHRLALTSPLAPEIWEQVCAAELDPRSDARLFQLEDDVTLIEDRAMIPLSEFFPAARWAVVAVGPSWSFVALFLGRREVRTPFLADPILKAALLRRLGDRVPGGSSGPREASDALARISHEFKTPLVSIKGYAELILDRCGEELGPERREWVRRIAGAANRLAGVFRRATSEDRPEGAWAFEPRPVDPAEWLQWCLAEAQALAQSRVLEWSWEVAKGAEGPVALDPEAGRDLLLELLQNAARATPDGGRIRVTARAEERDGRDGLRVSVEDSGLGVPRGAAAERLFERFATLSGVMEHHSGDFEFGSGGLGLGLSLVRRVARAHGGEAWLEGRGRNPETLPGCAVHVWIPAARETPEEVLGAPGAFGGRVLVVDPDPEARRVLAKSLSPVCEVVAVGGDAEALEQWEKGDWQGCIVEPRLPGGRGLEIIRNLRSRATDPPILVYTTRAEAGEAEAWRAAGADAWLSKPARARLLVQRLQTLRNRRSRR